MSLLAGQCRLMATRAFSTTARAARQDLGGNTGKNPFGDNIPAKYKLIKEKQRTFNLDNGLRVHERGNTDAFFSNFTLLIVALGGVEWCRVVFNMAYPNGLK